MHCSTDKKVVRLEYEAYVPMAEQVMKKICEHVSVDMKSPEVVIAARSTEKRI